MPASWCPLSDSSFTPPLAPLKPPRRSAGRLRTITALILREMASVYGKSPGGYIWALLEPIGMIVLLSFGFSLLLRTPSLGNSFILFYATGYLVYNIFPKQSQVVGNALTFSKALLTYPAVSWLDAVAGRIILNMLTSVTVSYILLATILVLVDSRVVLSFGPIFQAYILCALLGIGAGLVNCAIIGFFPVWRTIWSVATRPLMLASGVIVIHEDLPPFAQSLLVYNPLMHVTGLMREGFYPMYAPQYISHIYVLVIGLSLIALGLMLLRRFNQEILNR